MTETLDALLAGWTAAEQAGDVAELDPARRSPAPGPQAIAGA